MVAMLKISGQKPFWRTCSVQKKVVYLLSKKILGEASTILVSSINIFKVNKYAVSVTFKFLEKPMRHSVCVILKIAYIPMNPNLQPFQI